MPNDDSFQLAGSNRKTTPGGYNRFKKIFRLIISNWYYFLIALDCCFDLCLSL